MIAFILPLLYAPAFYFAFPSLIMFGLFVFGLYIGVFLLWFDNQFGYRYYAEPGKTVQLITRSPLFGIVYVLLTIFMITSSNSPLGMGLVQGIGLTLAYELLIWRKNPDVLNARFFARSASPLSTRELNWLIGGFVCFVVLMTIMIFGL